MELGHPVLYTSQEVATSFKLVLNIGSPYHMKLR